MSLLAKIKLNEERIEQIKRAAKSSERAELETHYNRELRIVRKKARNEVANLEKEHKQELKEAKTAIDKEWRENNKQMEDKFVREIKSLRAQLAEKDKRLKKSQKGFQKYLDYAIKAFHLTRQLKAEAKLWMLSGTEYYQKMSKISEMFSEIDRFNEKNEEVIKDLLSYHNESDEEIVNTLAFEDYADKKKKEVVYTLADGNGKDVQ